MMVKSVKDFVDELQSIGRYSFGKKEVVKNLNFSQEAIKSALRRLIEKKRIALIRKGFYVIVPLEYQKPGIIPPSWFIHQLMAFLEQPYYVGLLSAAALHGASHQQPQEFHVVVDKQIQPIQSHGIRIRFFKKRTASAAYKGIGIGKSHRDEEKACSKNKSLQGINKKNTMPQENGINKIKTETGYINVSNPELTALDLMRYNSQAGGMNFVATVLAELSEQMKAKVLLESAKKEKSLVYIQRLGYVLDWLGNESLTSKLHQWFSTQKSNEVALVPALPLKNAISNKKWNILVNKEIEVDDL